MDVIAFDIDGTLLDSSEVDSKLYVESVRAVLGNIDFRDDWSAYEHVTDQGILRSIIRDNGLFQESALISKVRQVFVQFITDYLQTEGPFNEIPGARHFLRELQRSENIRIVYATGGWKSSARLKLQASGFPLEGVPLASSDEHDDRASIMVSAVSALSEQVNHVTYYGDGIWDKLACDELGWRFVAVGKKLGGIEAYETAA